MAFGIKPSEELSAQVKSLVEERGVCETAALLGIGREAASRLAAGFGVRKGTLALATKKLAQESSRASRRRATAAARS